VFAGRIAGHSVLTHNPDGSYDEDFEFNDRGRGPKLHTHTVVDAASIPTSLEVTGTDYFHTPVHEVLACDATHCKWDGAKEHGQGGHGFYFALDGGAPGEVFLRALRAAPGGALPLLPSGTAHVTKVAETTLDKGGEKKHVVAWETSGFALTPSVAWYDDDGAAFADVSDWSSAVREGWEDSARQLLALQKPLAQARRERIASQVSHKPDKGLAVVHARLFDPVKKTTTQDVTIVVEGGRIKSVVPKGAAPAGYEVLDANGKTVLPGLWDMHIHSQDDDGLLQVASGITTGRDLGNEMNTTLARRDRWDAGTEIGPHLLLAGLIDGRGEFQSPTGTFADTPEEALAAVDRFADKGYVQIKLYSSLKPELVAPIAKEAHARGMRVSGHVPAHMIAEDAVDNGFDELQHINFLILDLVSDRTLETRTPLRFTVPAEKAAGIDLDAPRSKALFDKLVAKHTVVDPTLSVFEDLFLVGPDHPTAVLSPILSRLPAMVQRGATSGGLPVPEGMGATYKDSFKRCEQIVKRLWDRHVPIVAGTDNFAGFSLHRELELYAEAGIPNADVLSIATLGAARVMKRENTSGSIAAGKDADLVIVDGDPLANMRDVRNVVTVVRGGRIVDANAALGALSIAPR
jgi:hypothetical protein